MRCYCIIFVHLYLEDFTVFTYAEFTLNCFSMKCLCFWCKLEYRGYCVFFSHMIKALFVVHGVKHYPFIVFHHRRNEVTSSLLHFSLKYFNIIFSKLRIIICTNKVFVCFFLYFAILNIWFIHKILALPSYVLFMCFLFCILSSNSFWHSMKLEVVVMVT